MSLRLQGEHRGRVDHASDNGDHQRSERCVDLGGSELQTDCPCGDGHAREHREEHRGWPHLHLLESVWDSRMLLCGSIARIEEQMVCNRFRGKGSQVDILPAWDGW